MIDLHAIQTEVEKLIRKAGAIILSASSSPVHRKGGHMNYVTDTDISIQAMLKNGLMALITECLFFAEEQENEQLTDQYTWVVDPLDGTNNFIRGRKYSSVSIALLKDKKCILGTVFQPFLNELYTAIRGAGAFMNGMPLHVSTLSFDKALVDFGSSPYYIELTEATAYAFREFLLNCGDVRRVGSAVMDCCDIASGRAEIFWEMKLSPWDFAAGSLLIEEAGGCFMMPYQDEIDLGRPACILATNAVCKDQALQIMYAAKERIK